MLWLLIRFWSAFRDCFSTLDEAVTVVPRGHLGQFLEGSLPLNEFRAWVSNAWCNDFSEAFDGEESLATAVEHAFWLFDEGLLDEAGVRDLLAEVASPAISSRSIFRIWNAQPSRSSQPLMVYIDEASLGATFRGPLLRFTHAI